jgi:hypothetical protein
MMPGTSDVSAAALPGVWGAASLAASDQYQYHDGEHQSEHEDER